MLRFVASPGAMGSARVARLATRRRAREDTRMRKVFHFDAPREKYHCDAAIVWCFDNRFQVGFAKYLKRQGIVNSDPIKIAGGAKSLASPEHESDREFVLDQIRKSIRLHGTRRVILMLHSDCGAYGGLAGGFGGDARLEAERQEEELRRAAECVRRALPAVEVEAYFVDFEGIWAVEAGSTLVRQTGASTGNPL
jgi:carbonic anhydrase